MKELYLSMVLNKLTKILLSYRQQKIINYEQDFAYIFLKKNYSKSNKNDTKRVYSKNNNFEKRNLLFYVMTKSHKMITILACTILLLKEQNFINL